MASRLSAFVVWAAVAASAVFWVMRLVASGAPVPAHATLVAETPAAGDWSRLLGARNVEPAPSAPAPVQATSTLKLVGVVAPLKASTREGMALIAIEDKPARPFRVGSRVDGDLVLLSVSRRGVTLGPRAGAATVTLELPALPLPATGRPGAGAFSGPGVPPPPGDQQEGSQDSQALEAPQVPGFPPVAIPQRAGGS